ncbi:hypothetical protein Tco_0676571 [Tanacetum coccineum]
MSTLPFADIYNLVTFLSKPVESDGFEQIVDFLNACSIRYALTVNPTIYNSCIQQFWATVKVKTVNREVQLQALVDGKKIIITEATIRRDLQLEDAEGSGYQQKDRKQSQNDKTEHEMEKTVQNQGQSPKMSKSESILKNQQSNRSRN